MEPGLTPSRSGHWHNRFPYVVVIGFYLTLNFLCCTSIVCVNKVIFNSGFTHGTLLTIIHFIITFMGLRLAISLGWMSHKKLSLRKVTPLCVTYSGFVVLTNLSLIYSSVGFTQLKKILNTPVVLVVEYFLHGKTYSKKVLASLVLIVCGVSSATLSDPRNTILGTLLGLCSIGVGCCNQILVGSKQKELQCDALQLLLYQAPLSALMLLPVIPIFDVQIWNFVMPDTRTIVLIFLSACCALGVNSTIFLLIGTTSPLAYNVFGQVKIVSLLLADFLFFAAPLEPRILSGIFVTLLGVFWYSYLRMTPPPPHTSAVERKESNEENYSEARDGKV